VSNAAAIILAAGLSSRMGAFKPLLTVNGETVADCLISLFLQCRVDVYLVTGWRQEELLAGIKNRAITIIHNADYERGMFTSIQAGARRIRSEHGNFFIMPVDIPLVRPVTIQKLLAASASSPGRIIYPVFNHTRGHPPLIPADLIPGVLYWNEEGGLKSFLATRESAALEVAVPDSNIHFDMDFSSDYEVIKSRFARLEIPSPEECAVILNEACPEDSKLKRHCLKVTEIADAIGSRLADKGIRVDLELIHAAAILHDIAKGQTRHEAAGAEMLRRMGFAKTADVVALHTDLSNINGEVSLESKIVFLADKLAKEDKLVNLEERYRDVLQRYSTTPQINEIVARRLPVAVNIQQEMEKLLGCPLASFLN
jgi:molybdenum cofactor cytidylyltransferase